MNKLSLAGALLLTLLFSSPAWAEEPAAWLDHMDGAKNVQKHFKGDPEATWYRAHLEMNGLILDGFRTDKDSLASLRFYLGCRVNLDTGSRIRIVSERNVVFLDKGAMWTFFKPDDPKKMPITIQTAGGVMAIKGTEFVVEVKDEGGQAVTEVSVLSGEVEVMPADPSGAQTSPTLAKAGMTVKFDRYGILEELERTITEQEAYMKATYAELWEVRKLLYETRELTSLLRYQKVRLTASEKMADNELRRAHYLASGQDLGAGGVGSTDTARVDSLLAEFDAKMAGKTGASEGNNSPDADIAALLRGEDPGTEPTLPSFDWGWMEGTRFGFLILDAEDDDKVFWVETTEAKSFQYPADAKPLPPGTYRYRVIPVDEEGHPSGRATEFPFSVEAP